MPGRDNVPMMHSGSPPQPPGDAAAIVANPKTGVGAKKAPMHLVPPVPTILQALAHADGARKYGAFNWRDSKVPLSTYIAAFERHIDALKDGEDNATDSGLPHLAHLMAGCAVVLDAQSVGNLIDDRPTAGAAARILDQIANGGPVSLDPD